jgi:hypothetical protein
VTGLTTAEARHVARRTVLRLIRAVTAHVARLSAAEARLGVVALCLGLRALTSKMALLTTHTAGGAALVARALDVFAIGHGAGLRKRRRLYCGALRRKKEGGKVHRKVVEVMMFKEGAETNEKTQWAQKKRGLLCEDGGERERKRTTGTGGKMWARVCKREKGRHGVGIEDLTKQHRTTRVATTKKEELLEVRHSCCF